MTTKTKQWTDGSSATIQYNGKGDGQIIITSDPNNHYEARSMQITVGTTDGSGIQRVVTVNQAAKQRIDLSTAVVTAANQTYSGSAKTPTPTVKLDGVTIPSTGYDVAYSNNTNAGTATITITGKGDYTGTASGTFTIAKASRTLSFADSYMVLNTSSTGTKTATPSAGSGDGAITYSIANTTYATINSSTGAVTSKTSDGSVIVTATIAEGQNYLGATATYTLYVFATTHDYSYSGSAKNVTLPPGTYKMECWGAQGGSNETNSTYGITAQAGGKGGYSVGQLTTAQALAIQVLVGGQGSASAAGYNGGGSTTGTSQYNSGDTFGYSKMGGGGGASDIRLSDGTLLSRMIVAGGGGGGAMCCKRVTTTSISNVGPDLTGTIAQSTSSTQYVWMVYTPKATGNITKIYFKAKSGTIYFYKITASNPSRGQYCTKKLITSVSNTASEEGTVKSVTVNETFGANDYIGYNGDIYYDTTTSYVSSSYKGFYCESSSGLIGNSPTLFMAGLALEVTTTSYTDTYESQVGYAGGGVNGIGYTSYYGTQNAAGIGGSFGKGANQSFSSARYASGAGGGGWYGGGYNASNSYPSYVQISGGGSGFVNTAASAGNRPSGYTGLELDSGSTYAGNTSFPAPGGGNETGHSGDGYIRITRIS